MTFDSGHNDHQHPRDLNWDELLSESESGGSVEFRKNLDQLRKMADFHRRLVDGEDPVSLAGGAVGADEPGLLGDLVFNLGDAIGPYTLVEVLGRGGMGIVFRAEQSEPIKRVVALKIIKAGMDSREVIARFESERQALAIMDHPNIARIIDAGNTESGRPFFVMDYVPGEPLTAYCDRNKLGLRERLELFIPVCDAIHHAHRKGVIHRDIKPSNVLVSERDGLPSPCVIDFGIAKAIQEPLNGLTALTLEGRLLGTPAYMSPEQAEHAADQVDTTSDVYSLGVLLYELLVGAQPFSREELADVGLGEILRVIKDVDPPRPSTKVMSLGRSAEPLAERRGMDTKYWCSELDGELDWITMKAMEKDQARRYPSAAELGQDVRRYIDGDPVVAGSPGRFYRLRREIVRHKTIAVAVLAVNLALMLGFMGMSFLYQRAETQRQEAEWNGYVANVGLAKEALGAHSPQRAELLLGQCTEELRGWEWRWLEAQARRRGEVLFRPQDEVSDVAQSHDGSRIAVAEVTGLVTVIDAAGAVVCKFEADDGLGRATVAFHPTAERLAVLHSESGRLVSWNLASGTENFRGEIEPLGDSFPNFCFSGDGKLLLVPGAQLHALNGDTGDRLWSRPLDLDADGEFDDITGVYSHPDPQIVLLEGRWERDRRTSPQYLFDIKGDSLMWDLGSADFRAFSLRRAGFGGNRVAVVGINPEQARSYTFQTPEGTNLARRRVGSSLDPDASEVAILDLNSGQVLHRMHAGDPPPVCLGLLDKPEGLVSGHDGGLVTVRNRHDGRVQRVFRGAGEMIVDLLPHVPGRGLVGLDKSRALTRWNTELLLPTQIYSGLPSGEQGPILFSPSGEKALVQSNSQVAVVDLTDRKVEFRELGIYGHLFLSAAFENEDRIRILSQQSPQRSVPITHRDSTLFRNRAEIRSYDLIACSYSDVRSVSLGARPTPALSVADSLFGLETQPWLPMEGPFDEVLAVAEAGALLVGKNVTGTNQASQPRPESLFLFDVESGARSGPLPPEFDGAWDAVVHPDGGWLAVMCRDDRVRVWNPSRGKTELEVAGSRIDIASLTFLRGMDVLAVALMDGGLDFYDIRAGKKLGHLQGMRNPVLDVDFDKEGDRLFTVTAAGAIGVYSMSRQTQIATFELDQEPGRPRIRYHPASGRLLVTGAGTLWLLMPD